MNCTASTRITSTEPGLLARFFRLICMSIVFSSLCLFNYVASLLIFLACGSNLLIYIPVLFTLVLTISMLVSMLAHRCIKRRLRQIGKNMDKIRVEEISALMSSLLEMELRQKHTLVTRSQDSQICLVCYEYPADTTAKPCGHKMLCGRCTWIYLRTCCTTGSPLRCIVCRANVEDYVGGLTPSFNLMQIKECYNFLSKNDSLWNFPSLDNIQYQNPFKAIKKLFSNDIRKNECA